MKERLKILRKSLKMTQIEFAERIGVKQSTIATYEIGRNTPTSAVINNICKEYRVREEWLRDGEGEMFQPQALDDELSDLFAKYNRGEKTDFSKKLIRLLVSLPKEQWATLERLARELVENQDAAESAADLFVDSDKMLPDDHFPEATKKAAAEIKKAPSEKGDDGDDDDKKFRQQMHDLLDKQLDEGTGGIFSGLTSKNTA